MVERERSETRIDAALPTSLVGKQSLGNSARLSSQVPVVWPSVALCTSVEASS